MQHDIDFDLNLDLDLRSNFDTDLSRSEYILFDAAWREEYDGVNIFQYLVYFKSYWQNTFRKYLVSLIFDDLWSLNRWPEVKSESIL